MWSRCFQFLSVGALLSVMPVAWATQQSQFEIVGVARDLSLLGVAEVWTDNATQLQQCQVSIYSQNDWNATQAKRVVETSPHDPAFKKACADLKQKAVKKFAISEIKWDLAEMAPKPVSVKDEKGQLLSQADLLSAYPKLQQAGFVLPDKSDWQVVVRSALQAAQPGPYSVVLRNPHEPAPYRTVQGTYTPSQVLLTPVRVMNNNHYGLVTLLFRETRQGQDGMDYFYHPYFMHWPEYSAYTVEQAKSNLVHASDYAMEADELVKGPNSAHLGYRSYLRLKTEKLSLEDLETGLEQASPAGKLYWLTLIHEAYPDRYARWAQATLEEMPKTTQLIEASGREWQTVSFESKLKSQMQAFNAH